MDPISVVVNDSDNVENNNSENSSARISDVESRPLLPAPPKSNLRQVWKLAPAIFIFVFSSLMTFVPGEQFILQKVCATFNSTLTPTFASTKGVDPLCRTPLVQQETATFLMTLSLFSSLPSLFGICVFGYLGDSIGRKFSMLSSVIGILCSQIGYLVVGLSSLPLQFLFIGNALRGLSGSWQNFIVNAFGTVAEFTDSTCRTDTFVKVEAVVFFAFMLGPAAGGLISTWSESNVMPFIAALFGSIVTFFYLLFVLPSRRAVTRTTDTTQAQPLLSTIHALFLVRSRRPYLLLTLTSILFSFSFSAFQITFVLYTATRFNWGTLDASLFLTYSALLKVINMGVVFPAALQIFSTVGSTSGYRKRDIELMCLRGLLVAHSIVLAGYGLANSGPMFYVLATMDSFTSPLIPLLRSILSQSVKSNAQGVLLSTVACAETLAGIFSPILFSMVYRATVGGAIGTVYFVMSGIVFTAAGLAMCAPCSGLVVVSDKDEDEKNDKDDQLGGDGDESDVGVEDTERETGGDGPTVDSDFKGAPS